jgi:sec-independent protein translocase protein TatA
MISGIFNPLHIAVLVGIALIVFGPSRLPELAKSLGGSMRELKSSISGDDDQPGPRREVAAAPAAAAAAPAAVAPDPVEAAA